MADTDTNQEQFPIDDDERQEMGSIASMRPRIAGPDQPNQALPANPTFGGVISRKFAPTPATRPQPAPATIAAPGAFAANMGAPTSAPQTAALAAPAARPTSSVIAPPSPTPIVPTPIQTSIAPPTAAPVAGTPAGANILHPAGPMMAPPTAQSGVGRLWSASGRIGGDNPTFKDKLLRDVARVGTGVLTAGDVAAESLDPRLASLIPGGELNTFLRNKTNEETYEKRAAEDIARQNSATEQQKAATGEKMAQIELEKLAGWKTSGEPFLDNQGQYGPKGGLVVMQENQAGESRIVPVGNAPTAATTAAAPTAAPTGPGGGGNPFTKIGATEDTGKEPATQQTLKDFSDNLKADYPNLTDAQTKALAARVRPGMSNDELDKLRSAAQQQDTGSKEFTAKQSEQKFENDMHQLQEQTTQALAGLTEQEKQQQIQKNQQTAQQAVDSLYYGLYDQQNYKDAIEKWHDSPSYDKDTGLVAKTVGGTEKEEGGRGAGELGVGLGLLAKTPATAIGAVGAGTAMSLFGNVVQGYVDTLEQAGISKEGHDAIQAYSQAVLARLQFDMQAMGTKASAMRMSQLMRIAVQNVPPPNIPIKDFNSRFNTYYSRMESIAKRSAPKGYTPPDNPYEENRQGQPAATQGSDPFTQFGGRAHQ